MANDVLFMIDDDDDDEDERKWTFIYPIRSRAIAADTVLFLPALGTYLPGRRRGVFVFHVEQTAARHRHRRRQ